MPTWWGKKSSKSKDQEDHHPHGGGGGGGTSVLHFNFIKPKTRPNKSFDEALHVRNSPRATRDLAPSAADSDEKRGLPLPRPSVSSTQSFRTDQGLVFGSASVSGSSVSSTGSYEDQPTYHSQIAAARFVVNCYAPWLTWDSIQFRWIGLNWIPFIYPIIYLFILI